MSSHLAQALSLNHVPLALYYAQTDPPEAKSFKKEQTTKGGWGCALFLLRQALDGHTVSFSGETCHCPGAAAGLGLAVDHSRGFPGGVGCYAYFLSTGNEGWAEGRAAAKQLLDSGAGKTKVEEFLKGEGYKKSPELVFESFKHEARITPGGDYVIIEPLAKALPAHTPEVVILLADALQLSALVCLANFARPDADNVRIPFSSGCRQLGLLPLFEATRPNPKAVAGLTDPSARLYLRKLLGRDLLSFAMPWSLYQEMEANVDESFLSRRVWKKLQADE